MSEDRVLAHLRRLKEADSGFEASLDVEVQLLKAFRGRKSLRSWKRSAALAAVAAVMVGIVVLSRNDKSVRTTPKQIATPVEMSLAVERQLPADVSTPSVISTPSRKKTVRREVATEFFPLMDTPPPFERGEIVRVVVPAGAMREVGLPVGENHLNDPVQADILVGQEGLARAIRFVDYRQ